MTTIASKRIPEPDDDENAVTAWEFSGKSECEVHVEQHVSYRRKHSSDCWLCLECYKANRAEITSRSAVDDGTAASWRSAWDGTRPEPTEKPTSGIRLVDERDRVRDEGTLADLMTRAAQTSNRTRCIFAWYAEAHRASACAADAIEKAYGTEADLHATNWIAGFRALVAQLERYACRHLAAEIEKAEAKP